MLNAKICADDLQAAECVEADEVVSPNDLNHPVDTGVSRYEQQVIGRPETDMAVQCASVAGRRGSAAQSFELR